MPGLLRPKHPGTPGTWQGIARFAKEAGGFGVAFFALATLFACSVQVMDNADPLTHPPEAAGGANRTPDNSDNNAPNIPTSLSCDTTPLARSTGNNCTLTPASPTDLDTDDTVTYFDGGSTCTAVVVNLSTGNATFTAPAKGATCVVRVRAYDGYAYSTPVSSATITGQNNAPNTPSALSCPTTPAGSAINQSCTLTAASPTDLDSDSVTYSDAGSTCGAVVVNGTTGNATFTAPARGATCVVKVKANDGSADSGVVSSSTITGQNNAPSTPTSLSCTTTPLAGATNQVCTLTPASPTDAEGDSVTYSDGGSTCTGVVVNGTTGNATFTAPAKGATCVVKVKANDGSADSTAVSSSTITGQNNAPNTPTSLSCTTSPSGGATNQTCTLTAASPVDPDGDSVNYADNGSTCADVVVNGSTGNATFTAPAPGATCVVKVKANDGTADSTAVSSSTITGQNNAPTISDIPDQQGGRDHALGPVAFTIGDPNGLTGLNVTAVSSDTTLVPNGSISLGGSGANRTITLTPAAGLLGSTTITVTVSDGALTASDTLLYTVDSVVKISPASKTLNTINRFTNYPDTSHPRYARKGHSLILLPSGKALALGGGTVLWTPLNSVERFDPADMMNYTEMTPLRIARIFPTATLLPNGKILVAGGCNGTSGSSLRYGSVELYDPAASGGLGSSTPMNSMSIPRCAHVAALLPSGKVLLMGGRTTAGYTNTVELYDPAGAGGTGTTVAMNPLNSARGYHMITALPNGKLLLAGGVTAGVTNVVELYDPSANGGTGSATTLTPMIAERDEATITSLGNGKVLIMGGYDNTGTPLNSVELYDPDGNAGAGSTTALANMNAVRGGHNAFLLPSGKVLVLGGYDVAWTPQKSVELYDPAGGGSTTNLAPLSIARYFAGALMLADGSIFIQGGATVFSVTWLMERYDPTGTGTDYPPTLTGPTPRAEPMTVLLPNGKVLLMGGNSTDETLNSVDIYDPATNQFTALTPMLSRRIYGTATLLPNGKVLLTGGYTSYVTYASATTVELYDPSGAGSSVALTPLNSDRGFHTATLLPDGKVLIAGGYKPNSYYNSVELYDPSGAGSTTTLTSLAAARAMHTAEILSNGKVIMIGGRNASTGLSSVELYDPAGAGSVTNLTPLANARYVHTSTLLSGDKILVAGGKNGSTRYSSVELYDPAGGGGTGTRTALTSLAVARNNHAALLLADGRILITGGINSSGLVPSSELYDPTGAGSVTAAANPDLPSYEAGAVVLQDGRVFISGGENTSGVDGSYSIFSQFQSQTFSASQGDGNYTYSVSSGTGTAYASSGLYIPLQTGSSTVRATDGTGYYDEAAVTTTATVSNTAPNAPTALDCMATPPAGATLVPCALTAASPADPDGESVTYADDGSTCAAASVSTDGTTILFTAPAKSATCVMKVKASDGRLFSSTTSSNLITGGNNPPATPASLACTTTPLAGATNQTCTLTAATPTDADGDSITYSDAGSTCAAVAVNGSTGNATFTAPAKGATCVVKVKANDSAADSGAVSSATITGQNNPPNTPALLSCNTAPDAGSTLNTCTLTAATPVDKDAGDTITYSDDGSTCADVAVNGATGNATFTAPAAGATCLVKVKANDASADSSAVSSGLITGQGYAFTNTWTFASGSSASYTYNPSSTDFSSGVVGLKAADQTDDTTAEFNAGTHVGTTWDGSKLRLGSAGGCDATATNCAELDASWAPGYSQLVAYWKLNNGWTDSIGTNTLTAMNGADFTSASKIGSHAAQFDRAASQYATLSDNSNFQFGSGDFSVAYWFYPRSNCSAGGATNNIWGVTKWKSGGEPGVNEWGLGNCDAAAAANNFYFAFESGITNHSIYSTMTYITDKWYHLVGSRIGTTIYLYVNGQLQSTRNVGNSAINSAGRNLRIANSDLNDYHTDGAFDDIAIWKGYGLTAGDVANLYSRQSAKYGGQFTSRVMDAFVAAQSWTDLKWTPTLPFFKELPDAAGTTPHANSESTTDYSTLVGSTGDLGANDLMSGIQGLWHFNETALNSATGGKDFADDSGNGYHADETGGAVAGALGRFGSSISLDGTDDYATAPISVISRTSFTASAWIKTVLHYDGKVISFGNGDHPLQVYDGGFFRRCVNNVCVLSSAMLNDLQWHHLVTVGSGSSLLSYVDGQLRPEISGAASSGNFPASITFGRNGGAAMEYFGGLIDEAAIWNRALTPGEVQQLYRRGINRLKYQVRTCSAANCSDQETLADKGWKGPDNSNQSYFSELNNNTAPTDLSGNVKKTLPDMALSVANNRYFQYRTILESDDTNNLCNYGSGTVPCSPELKVVSAEPAHYDTGLQTIIGNIGASFYSLTSLVDTIGGAGCVGGVKYNLALDVGGPWYYWTGAAWGVSNGTFAQANASSELDATALGLFATQVGRGTVYFKAFMNSNGSQACELDQLVIGGTASTQNHAPNTPSALSCNTSPDAGSTGNTCTLTAATPADSDGNSVTYLDAGSTCASTVVNGLTGNVTFTAPAESGTCLIKVKANDGMAESAAVVSDIITGQTYAFSNTWSFTSGTSTRYTYNPGAMDFSGGQISLTAKDQTDDTTAEFGAGSFLGSAWDGSKLRLGNAGGCDATTTNCTELDASWAPQWANLSGYWRFNGTVGAIAGGANMPAIVGTNGTAVNPDGVGMAYTAGKLKQGITLDGSDSYVLLQSTPGELFSIPQITISMWVKGPPQNNRAFFSLDSTGSNNPNYTLSSSNAATTLLRFQVTNDSNSNINAVNGVINVFDNNWHHILWTDNNGTVSAYIDGNQEPTNYSYTRTGTLTFNRIATGAVAKAVPGYYFTGAIDEVAIWTTALTATEARLIYNRQSAKYAGTFTSRVMDAGSTGQNWTHLKWTPTLPFLKELPDAAGTDPHANSEGTTDYASLNNSTLMNGIVGLWHFDETATNSAPGGTDFRDDSGKGNHATETGGVMLGYPGRFQSAVAMNGASSYITGTVPALSKDSLTISAWVRTGSGETGRIVSFDADNHALEVFAGLFRRCFDATCIQSTPRIDDAFWHHVVTVASATAVESYLDGKLRPEMTESAASGTLPTTFTIGRHAGLAQDFYGGFVDEVAIWNRALDAAEVLQLYRRGANRLNYQVRTCSAANCSDQDALAGKGWKGPDNTTNTFFSELNTNTAPTDLSGDVQKTLPDMAFSMFSGLGLSVANNRYFQYRTILESDDANSLCDYGSGAAPCSPELKVVAIEPVYDSTAPSIIGNIGVSFYSLTSLVDTIGGAGCAGGVKYNLALDIGGPWYYWTGAAWGVSNGTFAQANASSELDATVLGLFATQVGRGTVYFKAFMNSNGTQACELDQVVIGGTASAQNHAPNIPALSCNTTPHAGTALNTCTLTPATPPDEDGNPVAYLDAGSTCASTVVSVLSGNVTFTAPANGANCLIKVKANDGMDDSAAVTSTITGQASAFTGSWPFSLGSEASYTRSSAISTELTLTHSSDAGLIRLKPSDQTDDSTSAFSGGSFAGSAWDGAKLRLANAGGCDATATNCAELDASWAPQWDHLKAYWKFNNDWDDSVGTTHGTPQSGTPAFTSNSKIGSHAATFDGGSDIAIDSAATTLSGWNTGTVSAWFKTAAAGGTLFSISQGATSTDSMIFGVGACSASWADESVCFNLYRGNVKRLEFAVRKGNSFLSDSLWHHLVVTTGNGFNSIYIDGEAQSLSFAAGDANTNEFSSIAAPDSARISGWRALGLELNLIDGQLDELSVWNVALTSSEVRTLYDRQSASYSGTFTSRIMDAFSTVQTWTNLRWTPTLPFFKELPDAAGSNPHANSESSTDYSSLVGSTGSTGDDNLMTDIVGLWHLNETAAGSAPGGKDFTDDSGNGNHGIKDTGGVTFNWPGKLGGAVSLGGGANQRIGIADSASLDSVQTTGKFTVSAWIYPRSNSYKALLGRDNFRVYDDANYLRFESSGANVTSSSAALTLNEWQHVAMTYDRATLTFKMYRNGIEIYSDNATNLPTLDFNSSFYIGDSNWGDYWAGGIDEVAIWKRALHAKEIVQLYRRGANRLKYQARTCTASNCSDQETLAGKGWKGPDNTNKTYFSELNNNTAPADLSGYVQKSLPNMLFTAFSGLELGVSNYRYFQYRAILESDDANNLCNYGAGAAPCSPELKAVSVDPIHYDNSAPTVINNTGVNFYELGSLVETLGSASCAGTIKYNLGLSSTGPWYYWTGAAWGAADGTYAQANSQAQLTAGVLGSFSAQVGRGSLFFKTFLKSDGTQACELDNVTIEGTY